MFHDTTQSCWMQCFQGLIWIFEHVKFFKTNLNITINNTKYNFLCLKCLLFCNFNQIGTPTAINSMYSLFTTDNYYRKLVLSTVVEYVRRFVSLASNHKISEMHVSFYYTTHRSKTMQGRSQGGATDASSIPPPPWL